MRFYETLILPILCDLAYAFKATELTRIANGSFHLENIAIRSNGDLLINSFDSGRIYTLSPSDEHVEAKVLVKVPEVEQLTGIAEVAPDVYVVTGGVQGDEGFAFKNGSARAAIVSLNTCGSEGASVRIIANVDSLMLNGMVALPSQPHVILSVDSIGGRMFRIDTQSGHAEVAWSDEQLGPGPDPQIVPLGANGLDIFEGHLYFTNSERGFYGRVKIAENGDLDGDFEEIWHRPEGSTGAPDDFDMTRDGVGYVTLQRDSLLRIKLNGEMETLLSPDKGDVKLESPTAVALSEGEEVLYIVTGGGQVVKVEL